MYVTMFARNTSIIFQFYFKNLSQISSAYCGKMGDPSNISNKSHKIMKKSSKKHTKKRTKVAKKLFDCNQTQKQTLISETLKLCMPYTYLHKLSRTHLTPSKTEDSFSAHFFSFCIYSHFFVFLIFFLGFAKIFQG